MELAPQQLLEMYRKMMTIRHFDQRAVAEFHTGNIPGVVHAYIGQEAVAVGVCTALRHGLLANIGMRRIARMADGWLPLFPLDDTGIETIARVRRYTEEAGRDPSTLGMEGRISLAGTSPDEWVAQVKGWQEAGATHLAVGTSGGPLTSAREHIEAIQQFKEVVGS